MNQITSISMVHHMEPNIPNFHSTTMKTLFQFINPNILDHVMAKYTKNCHINLYNMESVSKKELCFYCHIEQYELSMLSNSYCYKYVIRHVMVITVILNMGANFLQ